MKRKAALLLISAILLTSCGNNASDTVSVQTTVSSVEITETETSVADVTEQAEEPIEQRNDTLLDIPETPYPGLEEISEYHDNIKDELNELYEALSAEKEHPIINIVTIDGEKINSKDIYTVAYIDVINCDEEFKLSEPAGVKIRGNSTADQGSEKPYRITFDKKHNMLGLHEGEEYKSWVLLRSYWNLVPDFMAQSLAKTIFDGKYYSSDCRYVNLYINGKFINVYLLCEQNQAKRIGITEPKSDEYEYETGYFLEMDNYPGEDHAYFTLDYNEAEIEDINGETRSLPPDDFSVRSDINTEGQLGFIEKYMNGVWNILYESIENGKPMMFDENYNLVDAENMTPEEAVRAVIDTDSAVNMLILEELVHNNDVGAGSFYMAVDFSENSRYEKLTMLAPWDFNWSYEGTPKGYYASTWQNKISDVERSNVWFILLMKAEWFRNDVKKKFLSLSESGSLKAVTSMVHETAESMRNDLGDNAWSADCGNDIVKFVEKRIKWLTKTWSEESSEEQAE